MGIDIHSYSTTQRDIFRDSTKRRKQWFMWISQSIYMVNSLSRTSSRTSSKTSSGWPPRAHIDCCDGPYAVGHPMGCARKGSKSEGWVKLRCTGAWELMNHRDSFVLHLCAFRFFFNCFGDGGLESIVQWGWNSTDFQTEIPIKIHRYYTTHNEISIDIPENNKSNNWCS